MYVWAFIRCTLDAPTEDDGMSLFGGAHTDRGRLFRDPFVHCHGVDHTIVLPVPDVVASPNEDRIYIPAGQHRRHLTEYPRDPTDTDAHVDWTIQTYDAGQPVLTAVCLGTASRTWSIPGGQHWWATPKDLTFQGRKLLKALSRLYGGRKVELVTYVDT